MTGTKQSRPFLIFGRRQDEVGGNRAPHCAESQDDDNDYHDYFVRWPPIDTGTWTVAQAKAKLSEIIGNAHTRGPQTITRNGRRTAVVVDAEEWERRTQRSGALADFFDASPLRGSAVKVHRSKDRLRAPGL